MENGNGENKQELLSEAYNLLGIAVAKLVDEGLGTIANRLSGVEIRWNDSLRKTAGTANKTTGIVELSWPIFRNENNLSGFVPTVYHELAHIASPVRGHKKEWKLIAGFLGGEEAAKRTHRLTAALPGDLPYPVFCPSCDRRFTAKPGQASKMRKGEIYNHKGCGSPTILLEETELEKLERQKYQLERKLEKVADKIADIVNPEILPDGSEALEV